MKKNILVTGGLGYIGSHITTALLRAGYNVVVIDLPSDSKKIVSQNIEKITGKKPQYYNFSVADSQLLENVLKLEKIDTVIHLAGAKSICESVSNPNKYHDSVFLMSKILLESMINQGVKNLIFASTAAVYGKFHSKPIKEIEKTGSTVPYAKYKREIEKIIGDYAQNGLINAIVFRYFNVVGSHESGLLGENPQKSCGSIMKYLSKAYESDKKTFTIFGNDYQTQDGTAKRDYVHVMDVADAHVLAVEKLKEVSFEIINLCSGKPISVLQIFNTYNAVSGNEMKCKFENANTNEAVAICGNNNKAKQILGWQPRHDLMSICKSHFNFSNKQIKNQNIITKE